MFLIFLFMFVFVLYFLYFVYSVFYIFYIVLCYVPPFVCVFPIFVQVYRPLPPGGNPIAINKDHHHHFPGFIIQKYLVMSADHEVSN